YWPVGPHVIAQIAGQRVLEKRDDLPPDRLIEPHTLDQHPLQLRRGARSKRYRSGIAGDEEDRRIHCDHDEHKDQETETDALEGIVEHRLRAPQAKSRRMRRVAAALWTSRPRSRASRYQLKKKCVSSAVSSVRAVASVSASPLAIAHLYCVVSLAESGSSGRISNVSETAEDTVMPRSS